MRYYYETELSDIELKNTAGLLPNELLFNESVIDEYYGGDGYPGAEDIFVSCAQRMMDTLDGRLVKLVDAIHSNNVEDILYFSHQLKGSFNATGSPLLAKLCQEIEEDAKANDIESCDQVMSEVVDLSPKFVAQLRECIANLNV